MAVFSKDWAPGLCNFFSRCPVATSFATLATSPPTIWHWLLKRLQRRAFCYNMLGICNVPLGSQLRHPWWPLGPEMSQSPNLRPGWRSRLLHWRSSSRQYRLDGGCQLPFRFLASGRAEGSIGREHLHRKPWDFPRENQRGFLDMFP